MVPLCAACIVICSATVDMKPQKPSQSSCGPFLWESDKPLEKKKP